MEHAENRISYAYNSNSTKQLVCNFVSFTCRQLMLRRQLNSNQPHCFDIYVLLVQSTGSISSHRSYEVLSGTKSVHGGTSLLPGHINTTGTFIQIQQKEDFKYRIDARLQALYISLRASSGPHLDESWCEISSLSDSTNQSQS